MIDIRRLAAIFNNPEQFPSAPTQLPFEMNQVEVPRERPRIAEDEFLSAIREQPQRENPSLWRKLAAIGPALGGNPRLQDDVLFGNYNRQMDDWKARIQPLYQAAGLERMNNSQELKDYYQNAMLGISQQRANQQGDRYEQLASEFETKSKQKDEQLEISRKNTKLAEDRLEVSRQTARGGTVVKDNKNGKTYLVYKDGTKKDLDIDTLSKEDEIELANAGRLQIIEASSGLAEGRAERLARLRSELDKEEAAHREELRLERERKEKAEGIRGGGTEESNTQKEAGRKLRARELVNRYPELAQHIDTETGAVKDTSEGGFFGIGRKLNEEQRKKIVGYIEDSTPFDTGTPAPVTPPKPAAKPSAIPSANTGTPKVGDTKKFPNGKTGRWDGQGWVLVQ